MLSAFLVEIVRDNRITLFHRLDFKYLKTLGESGQVLATVWSIIGVLLIVVTLNVQKEQFADNKNFIEKQQFETTFFNMLNVLFNIKIALKREVELSPSKTVEGQHLIDYMKFELGEIYKSHLLSLSENSPVPEIIAKVNGNQKLEDLEREILKAEINGVYMTFYKKYYTELGHFFRYLYNIIKFTRDHRFKHMDDQYYVNMIQAQLSNNELALIFYNVISEKSLNKEKISNFFNLLEEYNFFENIDESSLIDRSHHTLYPKTNFKFLNIDEKRLRAGQ